jgi:hypothetical protein
MTIQSINAASAASSIGSAAGILPSTSSAGHKQTEELQKQVSQVGSVLSKLFPGAGPIMAGISAAIGAIGGLLGS